MLPYTEKRGSMKKKVTFSDIARYTNFSKTTISRYFNNPDSLAEESQQKIAEALVALDYKENKVARILANGKTEFIGIIAPNFFHQFYSNLINQLLDTYRTHGYKFIVFLGNDDVETERQYVQELMSYQIEALIVLSHTMSSYELSQLDIPVVSIEREDEFICSVNSSNLSGAVQATKLLHRHGCDVLLHINNPTDPKIPSYGRIVGFEETCKRLQVPYEIYYRDFVDHYHDTKQKLLEIFEEIEEKYSHQKKGIFLSNDTLANIFLNIALSHGKRVPEDYELIGFDNSPIAEQAFLPLTTIAQDTAGIVDNTMKLLTKQIDHRKGRRAKPVTNTVIEHILVQSHLVERSTTSHP